MNNLNLIPNNNLSILVNSNNCLIDWNINAFFKGKCNSQDSKNSNSLIMDEIIKNMREDIINNKIKISEN
jgi:hypothetical protein